MNLDGEEYEKKSIVGGLCSLILTFIMIMFAYQKADVLWNKKNVDIRASINEYYFSPDHVFNYENGFNFALGFTEYGKPDTILDPEIGELRFSHFSWGPQADGTNGSNEREQIPHHSCSAEELGLDETDRSGSKFLPVHPSSIGDVKSYQKSLLCVDTENLYVYGDYSSYKAS